MAFEPKPRGERPPEEEPDLDEDDSFAGRLLGAVFRPLDTLQRVADREEVARAAVLVTLVGALWAGFSAALHAAGHQPSFTGNPIPAERYYAFQAGFVVPLLLVGWAVFAGVAHGLARFVGGGGTLRSTLAVSGFTFALPILLLFLVPDVLVYAVGGFVELGFVVRLTAPLTALWMTIQSAAGLRAAHGLSFGRAAAVVGPSLLATGLVVGSLLR